MPKGPATRNDNVAELKTKLARHEREVLHRALDRQLVNDGLRLSMENEALKKEIAYLKQQLAGRGMCHAIGSALGRCANSGNPTSDMHRSPIGLCIG